MTALEHRNADSAKRMSGVLWDLFSGSASYTNVLMRTLHPKYIASLIWNLVAGNISRAEEDRHVQH
jgi:hypothetical protein